MEGRSFSSARDSTPFEVRGYRSATEVEDGSDVAIQSVSYDSGICLSNYKSTDRSFQSKDGAFLRETLVESLNNLNLHDQHGTGLRKEPETMLTEFNSLSLTNPVPGVQLKTEQTEPASEEPQISFLEDHLFQQDEEGDTRLHLAIIRPDVSTAFRLIELTRIAEYLDIQNKLYMHAPLHLAVITEQPPIVRALIVSGASITTRDRHGNTPLHLACKQGSVECVRQLTAPPSDQERHYVWHYCQTRGLPSRSVGPVQPSEINLMNYEGETCLHLALSCASETRTEIINYLVHSCGANINVKDGKCGYTVLHQAVKMKDAALVQFLAAQSGISVNDRCYSGCTALDIAISLNLPELELILRTYGGLAVECSSSTEQSDDSQVDEFDDLMIGGLRLNM